MLTKAEPEHKRAFSTNSARATLTSTNQGGDFLPISFTFKVVQKYI